MADKSFDRLRRFNFKIFRNLPQQSKTRISGFYKYVLGASKKYNPFWYHRREKDKK